MSAAALAFAASGLGIAITAVVLAIRNSGLKSERGDLRLSLSKSNADLYSARIELEESNRQLGIRDRLLKERDREINRYRQYLREIAPNGAAAREFDRMFVQKGDSDSKTTGTVSEGSSSVDATVSKDRMSIGFKPRGLYGQGPDV